MFENGISISYAVLKDTVDNSDDRYNLAQGTKTPDFSSSFVGSFLVRDVATVPVPAAVWLFGSDLIGLVGVARRKKA